MSNTPNTVEGLFLDNGNAAYDAIAKRFLARKVFLARILKRCMAEFRDCAVEDIASKYIEGKPEVGTVPVAPNLTNAPRKILGDNVEYKTLTEGMTTFDIRLLCCIRPVHRGADQADREHRGAEEAPSRLFPGQAGDFPRQPPDVVAIRRGV